MPWIARNSATSVFLDLTISSLLGTSLGLSTLFAPHPLLPAIVLPFALSGLGRQSTYSAMASGFFFGLFCCLASTPWLPDAFRNFGATLLGSFFGWLVFCVWGGGAFFAALSWVLRCLTDRSVFIQAVAVGVSVLIWEGLCTTTDFGIPAFLIAHLFASSTGVIQLAAVVGVPGLSALLALSAFICGRMLRTIDYGRVIRFRVVVSIGASWLSLGILALDVARHVRAGPESRDQASQERHLLLIQPNFSRADRWVPSSQSVNFERISAVTQQAISRLSVSPDLILWPENTLTAPIDRNPELRAMLLEFVSDLEVPVLTGIVASATTSGADEYRNAAVWIDPDAGIVDWSFKSHTVPAIESTSPIVPRWLQQFVLGDAARWPQVERVSQEVPIDGGFPIGVLLCYEALQSTAADERRTPETVALVNLADDSWVDGKAASREFTRIAAFRAIEQRLPLIRLAHGGLSVAFDEFGRQTSAMELDAYDSMVVRVAPKKTVSSVEAAALLVTFVAPGILTWVGSGRVYRSTSNKGRRQVL